jgi:hypothetical protein
VNTAQAGKHMQILLGGEKMPVHVHGAATKLVRNSRAHTAAVLAGSVICCSGTSQAVGYTVVLLSCCCPIQQGPSRAKGCM